MTPEQARLALEILKQSEQDRSERRQADMESHLSQSDRVIAQLAQLKLLNEDSALPAMSAALLEAAQSASPL